MTWYCLSYNCFPRCIFQANSLEEAEKTRVKYQEFIDKKAGYKTFYVYCSEVPLISEIIK
jgi:hypothetical protein